MRKTTVMSEAEKEVMRIIWASDDPVTSNQILERLPPERNLKITTVLTFLSRLVEKGLLKNKKVGKKNYYYPQMDENEYKRQESRAFLESLHGGSIKSFFAALYDGNEISRKEIEELKKWLEER